MSRLTASDILKPQGDLDASLLFPGISASNVKNQIDSWLKEAYKVTLAAGIDEVKTNAPALKYVYYKAYADVYVRFLASPIRSEVMNEAMDQYDIKQIAEFKVLSNDALAEYQAIIGELLNIVPATGKAISFSMPTEITW